MSADKRVACCLIAAAAMAGLAGCGGVGTCFVSSPDAYVTTKAERGGTPFKVKAPDGSVHQVDKVVSRAVGEEVSLITGLRIRRRTMVYIPFWFLVSVRWVFEGNYYARGDPEGERIRRRLARY